MHNVIKKYVYFNSLFILKIRFGINLPLKMASIISSKRENGKIIAELLMETKEMIELKGHMDNIHLVSAEAVKIKTKLSQRGKNNATKYFLIPKILRKDLKTNSSVLCQRIKINSGDIFVYLIENAGK